MHVLLLEPYLGGSHAAWVKGYVAYSRHEVTALTLPGCFWKWRMHGGAVTLARQFLALAQVPDCILVTDMLDLTTFLALTRSCTWQVPAAVYFHENQMSYPWAAHDRDRAKGHDVHYGFINYISALAADAIFFNSAYHRESFFTELPRLLKHFPDYNELDTIAALRAKSAVLPLGLNLTRLDAFRPSARERPSHPPVILWNHRWEYDKNPGEFFTALYVLIERGLDFRVVILGECPREQPVEFLEAQARLGERVLHMGYVAAFEEYARWLWHADILPVTSHHDFFGSSVVEAIYCGCFPLLPDRLSYPELIPHAYHPMCLYRDLADLVERLSCLITCTSWPAVMPLQSYVARFDWHVMAPQYDDRLEMLCRSPGGSRTIAA
ncbi:MAG: tRNA-queuosine alpha-mannosyltransferase domain-containing protein [Anaerolineae bacterium]